MHGCRFVLLIAFVFLAVGCQTISSKRLSATPSFLGGDNSEIRKQLLKIIPIGTSHEDAERLVKSLGLELTPESDLGSKTSDAIHCQYAGRKGLFGYTIWLIQIDCSDGKVADMFCEQIGIDYGLLYQGSF